MADDISKISDGSVGFLNQNGSIKSTKQDQEAVNKVDEATKAVKAISSEDTTTISGNLNKDVNNAFAAVRQKTNEDISAAANSVNNALDNIDSSKDVVKREIELAKELRQASKDGDQEKTEKLKEEFKQLQVERERQALKVEQDNRRAKEQAQQSVSVGNKKIGSIEPPKVEFEKSSKVDLESKEAINAVIEQRQKELEQLKEQEKRVKETREEIKSIAQEARGQIDSIQKDSVQSIKQAEEQANKIAQDIKSGGAKAFEQASLTNINESIVRNLVA